MLDLGCWAQHLLHHLRNKRLLLVEPVVLQRLHSIHSLIWEPHLQLVKAEMKIKGTAYSLSLPSPCWMLWTASAKLKSSEETSVVIQNVGLRLSRVTQITPTGATTAGAQQLSASFGLGTSEQEGQAAGRQGVTAGVAAPA